jgi:hypothetical protein
MINQLFTLKNRMGKALWPHRISQITTGMSVEDVVPGGPQIRIIWPNKADCPIIAIVAI